MNNPIFRQITINQIDSSAFRIVYPEDGIAERQVAVLLQNRIFEYTNRRPELISDASPASPHEIRIGKTNRTAEVPDPSSFKIEIAGAHLNALAVGNAALSALSGELFNSLFHTEQKELNLTDSESVKAVPVPENLKKTADLRIMYHNIWGYLNAAGDNPVANRSELALTVYREYQPDILCLQECSKAFRDHSVRLFSELASDYQEICVTEQAGIGNPIFFKTAVFEEVEHGYTRFQNPKCDKGTTWVVLRCKENGKLIAVTNSHFISNANVKPVGDPVEGNAGRIRNAQETVDTVKAIRAKYPHIDIISGGDLNSNPSSDAYRVLMEGGLVNLRDIAEKSFDFSPYNGGFEANYLETEQVYRMNETRYTPVQYSIDHILTCGKPKTVAFKEYAAVSDAIASTSSDHIPHFADFSWT